MPFHWEFVRQTETNMQKQMWKILRKFATGEICLWQPAKDPLYNTHTQHLTIMEQEVMFLVDDHYHTCKIASHLTTMTLFPPYQCRFKTQHHKHGLNVAAGSILQLCSLHQGERTAFPTCSLPAMWELQQYHFAHKVRLKFLKRQNFCKTTFSPSKWWRVRVEGIGD